MQDTVRHYVGVENGEEYVTRKQISARYNMPLSCLQRRLHKAGLRKVVEGTRFYFLLKDVDKLLNKKTRHI
ncbi:hypothetical protein DDQ68_04575 [Hymenobacter nivis]|uniref:DNA-binding protein n=1 Tax=Hymenobacter nivis TaxID=1850093 RepID=A0A2Z3GJG3_9BACT|nr:hypothetical protein DDQ68_04575 [Hymenobacter nivis]